MLHLEAEAQSQVNTEDTDNNSAETVTYLSGGGYVVTWNVGNALAADPDWYWADVHAQIYNADGTKVGGEFVVNTTTNHDQALSTVVPMADGGFIIIYQSTQYDPASVEAQTYTILGASVLAQRFSATGAQVNLWAEAGGPVGETVLAASGWTPTVALADDGSFLMVWQTQVEGVGGFQITFYDAEEDTIAISFFHPAVHDDYIPQAVIFDGGAMLVYVDSSGGTIDVKGQLFSDTGLAVGAPITVNTYTTATQHLPAVAQAIDGSFIVTWSSQAQDGSSYGVYGQIFNASGVKAGTEFRINTTTAGSQNVPDVTALDNGYYAVVWQSNGQDGDGWGAYMQIIDGNGVLLGGEIRIADETVGTQSTVKIASHGDTIVVTWSGSDAEGDTNIYTRQFTLSDVAGPSAGNDTLQGDGNPNTIDGLGGNDSISGLGDNDTLTGGDGNDTLNGGDGDDVLNGGEGDNVDGGAGSDRLVLDLSTKLSAVTASVNPNGGYSVTWTGAGMVAANIEAVTITTGNGNDIINGLDGNDVISTGGGFDRVWGGNGADWINVGNGGSVVWHAANQVKGLAVEDNAADTIIGGMGGDTVYVGLGDTADGGAQPNVIDRIFVSFYGRGSALNLDLSTGDAYATLGAAAGGSYANFEEIGVFGSTFADLIKGTDGSDRLFDLAPADGDGGNDTLYGLGGDDFLSAGSGANYVDGGDGNDMIYNTSFQDETLIGGAGNDTFFWGSTAPVDVIGTGNDTVEGGDGIDTIDFSKLVNGVQVILNQSWNSVGPAILTHSGVENLIGGSGNDTLHGNYEANYIIGGAGNDDLSGFGGAGVDTLAGGLGNDTFQIFGNDVASGEDGDDVFVIWSRQDGKWVEVYGGAGYDTIDMTQAVEGIKWVLSGEDDIEAFKGGRFDDGYDASATTTVLQRNLSGGGGNDTLKSGVGQDQLSGGDGNDYLDGGAGFDTMQGGLGDDTFVVEAATDVVTEQAGQGTDTVLSSRTYTLGANVENLTLTGEVTLNGTGNALNNVLTGNAGANVLKGGLGNDTYYVQSADDSVVETAGQGTDLVVSGISWTLGLNLEKLTLTGSENLTATGNTAANVLTGNDGNNLLDGGASNDTMIGGLGDDTFVVNADGDVVTELAGQGTDTVLSSRTHTLASNVENLVLTGAAANSGMGNDIDNTLTGNDAANWLDGKAGNDTLVGGLSNDTYVVDAAGDVTSEAEGGGTDTVRSSINWTLGANVEILLLTGNAAINGAGNELNNVLTGNTADNVLSGGLGNDTYNVQNSTDTVAEGVNEGIDSVRSNVSFTLGANVENLSLSGNNHVNATGNDLGNVLIGNVGNNILKGGLGDDTYYIQNVNDFVVEQHLQGNDTVYSTVTYSLVGRAVENLILQGTENLNATGNGLANGLTGNSGNNVLSGGAGNDTYYIQNAGDSVVENANEGTDTVVTTVAWTLGDNIENGTLAGNQHVNLTGNALNNVLTGNVGNNRLEGGLGNDTYYVQNVADNVVEAHLQGTDLIYSTVTYSLLGRAVENLTLQGTADINATGNGLVNVLIGNSGANRLEAGAGNDTFTGGQGADAFVFLAASGKDTVTDFSGLQNDSIDIHAYTNGTVNLGMVTQVGANVLINLGGGNTVTVTGANSVDVLAHIVW